MYFVVQDWMVRDLSLKGNELLVYAVIYGYSQEGQGCYYGGMSFLAETLGITRQTAIAAVKNLAERGLIERREETRGATHFVTYEARIPDFLTGCKNSLQGGVKNFDTIINKDNINNNYPLKESKEKAPIELPYNSGEFLDTWAMLVSQPKWRGKSRDALAKCAKMLAGYPERIAIEMMNASIRNGWQGLFPLKSNDIGKTSSAQSRAHDARVAAEERLAATLAEEGVALIEGGAVL